MVSDRPGLPHRYDCYYGSLLRRIIAISAPGQVHQCDPGRTRVRFCARTRIRSRLGGAKPGLPHPGRAAKGRPGASGGVFLVRSIRSIRFI